MAKLGKISLLITDEGLSSSVTATSYPVEKGEPLTDHVQEEAQTLSISGFVLGSDYKSSLQYFRDSMRKGTPLTFTGRTIAKNVIITSIDDSRTSDVGNGSAVSIKLQFVRFASTSWTKVKIMGRRKQFLKNHQAQRQFTMLSRKVILIGDVQYNMAQQSKL
ncbi:phage baseplate protein [Heyndrickxia ginsengihumi]|uniref:phage baseplate protein n=1 Tax=Heyndrickxia ginsengihumi TaxID=363870 RepID=UPI001F1F771A|nr:LysM domain-containing protein [Heyndrickxia ginsengihumi]